MQFAGKHRFTEEEYLAAEAVSVDKHEFLRGEIFAMAGGSVRHAVIHANVIRALGNLVRKPCRVLTSEGRIHIPATGLYTYPDASVVCGALVRHTRDRNSVTNPTLLLEVLSKSTADYDRGGKFAHYRTITTLQEYVLVAQDEHCIEHHRRLETGQWLLTEVRTGAVELPVLGGALALDEIYDGSDDLEEPADEATA